MGDRDLRDFFASCGSVLSTDIWTDANGRVTGRATVTFAEIAGAQAALESNGSLLLGRRIKIRAVRAFPPSTTLYVTNVAWEVLESDLWTVFSEPRPLQIRIPPAVNGHSLGFAHVQYRTIEEAQEALRKNNRRVLQGRPLDIFFSTERELDNLHAMRREVPARPPSDTLFVGNLPLGAMERDILNVFAEFRPVAVYVSKTSMPLVGSAKVRFRSVDEARMAMEACAGGKLFGRPLRIEFALRAVQNPPYNVLYVGNIDYEATNGEVAGVFAEFDPITVTRLRDNRGRPRPYAHVIFRSIEEAQRVLDACNNRTLHGRALDIAFSRPTAEESGSGECSPYTDPDKDPYTIPTEDPVTKHQIRLTNIPPGASVQAITEFIATHCGEVLSVSKDIDELGKFSGRVRVGLADSEGVKLALALDWSVFERRRIRIKLPESRKPTPTLFVQNLANEVTTVDLWDVFAGNPLLPKALDLRFYRKRGHAWVEYPTAEEAAQVRARLDQCEWFWRPMAISFIDY